jgi:membrane protein required for colicin V production
VTIIDCLILAVLAVSVVSAARAGLIVEVFSLAGLVLGLLLASWDYQTLMPWWSHWVHSAAAVGALSFLTIAFGTMLVAALAGRTIRWSVRAVGMGWADRMAGAVFGLVKGCAMVTIAAMVAAAFWPHAGWFRRSRLAPDFLAMARQAAVVAPADLASRIRSGVTELRKEQPDWLKPAA